MENKKMQEGEKYLTIVILGNIKVSAFPNKNRKSEKEPIFVGNGIAVWVNRKKPAQAPKVIEETI